MPELNSSVRSIHRNTFDGLNELRHLSLNINKLQNLPKVANLSKLVFLSLDFNSIQSLDGETVLKQENLETLKISHNRLKFINFSELHIPKLKKLELKNNSLSHVKITSSSLMPYLETLDIDGNNISFIVVKGLKHLISLDASSNGALIFSNTSLVDLAKLQKLYL